MSFSNLKLFTLWSGYCINDAFFQSNFTDAPGKDKSSATQRVSSATSLNSLVSNAESIPSSSRRSSTSSNQSNSQPKNKTNDTVRIPQEVKKNLIELSSLHAGGIEANKVAAEYKKRFSCDLTPSSYGYTSLIKFLQNSQSVRVHVTKEGDQNIFNIYPKQISSSAKSSVASNLDLTGKGISVILKRLVTNLCS